MGGVAEESEKTISTGKAGKPDPVSRGRRVAWLVAVVCFSLGVAYFGWRGPWRALHMTRDFPTFYAAARAWLVGQNPYERSVLQKTFDAHTFAQHRHVDWFLNPPGTLPILGLLGVGNFRPANTAWLVVTLGLIAVIIWETARLCGLRPREPGFWLLAGFILAMSPFHTSVAQGQLSVAVTVCLLGALRADLADRPSTTGILLAVAASLKPQMVFTFGLYYLLTARWRVCLAGLAGVVALTAIGVLRMEAAGVVWWHAWQQSFATSSQVMNSPDANGLSRYIILSLPMLLYSWMRSPVVVQSLNAAVMVLGFALTLWVAGGDPKRPWLERNRSSDAIKGRDDQDRAVVVYSLLALLALLGVYHRIYDATVLVLPIALAVRLWRVRRRVWAEIGLVLMAPMVVSGAAALVAITERHRVPSVLAHSLLWRGVVLPHVVWLVLVLFGWTLALGISFGRLKQRE